MLMHEWLQFRDKNVRRLSDAQAEAEAEKEAEAGAEQAEEAALEAEAAEALPEAEAEVEAETAGEAAPETSAAAKAPAPAASQPAAQPAETTPARAPAPRARAAEGARTKTPRAAEERTVPKTAREVLESLQPSADVRERLEAVLARQRRLPLDEDAGLAESRRPRRAAETREQLVSRLLDPTLSLQETALLLGVCATTVRRYTNRGVMKCFRTPGNQRRFKLSDVLEFMERREHGEV